MKMIMAQSAGFCFGVKHAVDTADQLIRSENQ
jgi:4-hydroxy-3-methylbut-2-enyl diphosphate reductase IspH